MVFIICQIFFQCAAYYFKYLNSNLIVFVCFVLLSRFIFFCFLGEKTGCNRLPYTSLEKGQFNLELHGLPDGTEFKDQAKMGEASLTAIIQHAKSLFFTEKFSGKSSQESTETRGAVGHYGADGDQYDIENVEGSGVVGQTGVDSREIGRGGGEGDLDGEGSGQCAQSVADGEENSGGGQSGTFWCRRGR